MGRLALEPSRAIAQMLKHRRQELGLTLRDVQEQTEALGRPIPFTTLAKVEQGRVDPGVKRLHVLLNLYNLPVQLADDLLDLEEFSAPAPPATAPSALYEEGVKHWKAGDLRRGIAHLFALRTHIPREPAARTERQKALLAFAVMAGSLGKHRLSREIVDGLLLEPPEPSILVQVLIQAAACWHRLGSREAALGFLSRADAHLVPTDHQKRAWILHERASTLVSMASFDEAEQALAGAVAAYESARDVYGENQALGVRVRLNFERSNFQGALDAARAAREHAERHGFGRFRVMSRLDEGRALMALGQQAAGVAALDEGLSESIASQDCLVQFYAHYYLWKGHASVGNGDRAQLELQAAKYHVRFVDTATPEALEIRAMFERSR